jgi:hypothetical protein
MASSSSSFSFFEGKDWIDLTTKKKKVPVDKQLANSIERIISSEHSKLGLINDRIRLMI